MLRLSSGSGGLYRILCRRTTLVAREVEVERARLDLRGWSLYQSIYGGRTWE